MIGYCVPPSSASSKSSVRRLIYYAKLSRNAPFGIPDVPQIIAFRNVLIHGYASVNDLTVWRTIDESLPTLYETVTSLLDEAGAP